MTDTTPSTAATGLRRFARWTGIAAIGLVGAVSVPLYYTSPPAEIEAILSASGARLLLVGAPKIMERLGEITRAGADLPVVAGIYGYYAQHTVATFDEAGPSVDAWREKAATLAGAGLPFLVVEVEPGDASGSRVAGYAYAGPFRPKPAYRLTVEDSVYVDPAWAGRGLGRLLLEALLPAAAEAGARQMVAVIADAGIPAPAALHRSLGFADVGRLRGVGFKHGRFVDTVLMQRGL